MLIKILTWLRAHTAYHRETYIFAPLAFLGLLGAILWVSVMTGRDCTEDLGALVGSMVNLARASLICVAAGLLQAHFFGFRGEQPAGTPFQPDLRDDVFDAIVTFALFLVLGYVVFFK